MSIVDWPTTLGVCQMRLAYCLGVGNRDARRVGSGSLSLQIGGKNAVLMSSP